MNLKYGTCPVAFYFLQAVYVSAFSFRPIAQGPGGVGRFLQANLMGGGCY